jgi:hypothetical protein
MFQTKNYRSVRFVMALCALVGLALPVSADDQVPFRGRADETVTDVVPEGPGLLLLTVADTGQATHLGLFTGTEAVEFDLGDGTIAGTRVFIAANGDRLYADVEGEFTSATTAAGTFTFTGGTGRFRNATGQANFEVVTTDGIHIALTFEGSIEY